MDSPSQSFPAVEFSEDMQTRENMGLIGVAYPKDGTFEPELEEPFWNLKANEVSDVIKTTRGFWIIKHGTDYPANEAEFYDMRPDCLNAPTPSDSLFLKWLNSTLASDRYTFERRMPGWDCQAGQD